MKFLIAVFFPASPFINFGDFCQPPSVLHPPRLLFWPKFASLPVYSALPSIWNLRIMKALIVGRHGVGSTKGNFHMEPMILLHLLILSSRCSLDFNLVSIELNLEGPLEGPLFEKKSLCWDLRLIPVQIF